MDPYDRLVASLRSPGLDPQMVAAISAWLNGGILKDPQAVAYVARFLPGVYGPGGVAASPAYHPGPVEAPKQAPPAQPATSPPPSAQGARQTGDPNPPGSDPYSMRAQNPGNSTGGLASNYLATKVAASQQGAGLARAANAAAAAQTAPPLAAGQQPTQQPKADGTAMASGFGGPAMPGNGNVNTAQGATLLSAAGDNPRISVILRALGFDPTRGGLASQRLAQILGPELDAASQFAGYANGGNGNIDYSQALNYLKGIGQSFLAPGVDAYGKLRQMGQGILNNPSFQADLGGPNGVGDYKVQEAMLNNLLPLLYGGANQLKTTAAQNNLARLGDLYNVAASGFDQNGNPTDQYKGNFTDYLNSSPTLQAIYKSIYGG